ncbi:MAG: histidinol-phosphate transaminase [Acidimicrobiaceae bacterium]|nr:histidinol-phosphate transaminase [Acidimicrobiaceae bacterium]
MGKLEKQTEHRARARSDVASLVRYHSPQVDIDVRLNTNEAAEPPPVAFMSDLQRALDRVDLNRYPDREARELRVGLGERYGLSPDWVFCANGSNEVLQTLLLAYGGEGRCAAVFEPTYAMHSQIVRITGTRLVGTARRSDFSLDQALLAGVVEAEKPDVLFLCSPNNPTGQVDSDDLIQVALELLAPHGGLLIVDEAYGQFTTTSAANLLREDRSLVVSRTFSKTWAMAGLRLGYLLGPPWCLSELEKVVLPYHLDSIKQEAGLLALAYGSHMEARVEAVVAERQRLTQALRELPVTVWPSQANFVLFRPESMSGTQVWRGLLGRSVLVRDFSTAEGLDDCLRVTIGTQSEDDRFLVAMREVLL